MQETFPSFETLLQRLDLLQCPIQPVSEWKPELVYFSDGGELRLSLIYWLLEKISNFALDISAQKNNPLNLQISDLLSRAHLLGLCEKDDFELLQGNSCIRDSIQFFHELSSLA
eukprot:Sdes_comp11680_c0_seq1m2805